MAPHCCAVVQREWWLATPHDHFQGQEGAQGDHCSTWIHCYCPAERMDNAVSEELEKLHIHLVVIPGGCTSKGCEPEQAIQGDFLQVLGRVHS